MAQDQAVLVAIPGIGKKLAERIIFELEEKVTAAGVTVSGPSVAGGVASEGEIVAALQALGYSLAEAREASRAALADVGVGVDARGAGQGRAPEPAPRLTALRTRQTTALRAGGPPARRRGARAGRSTARPGRAASSASVSVSRISSIASRTSIITSRSGQVASSDARARFVVAERDAAERGQRAVEQADDPADRDRRRVGRQRVAAVRPERRPDDAGVLERRHDLLEELRREPVALGERGQRDRAVALVADEVDEGAQAVLGAAGQAHRRIVVPKA